MAWKITLNGHEFNSDDMTLGELGEVEEASGNPWSLLNPWTDIKTAREFCRISLSRQGLTGADLQAALDELTAKDVKSAFDFAIDEQLPKTGEEDSDIPLDLSSRSSSPGAREGSVGGRAKPVKSVSAT